MRFELKNENRVGYIVLIPPLTHEPELHIITMPDAVGVGLQKGTKVELDFEGTAYTDGTRREGIVIGTVNHLPDPEPAEF